MSRFCSSAARVALCGMASAPYVAMDASAAEQNERRGTMEEVVVVAPYGRGIDPTLVPANVQRAVAEQLERSQSLDLTAFLNRAFGSVSINDAQNNPLQPDFNFRGFTASPLLGLAQGLAVYQNGVRINEPFGDTVNWDLIAFSAIQDVQLLAGTQPAFGLNTLGGALSMQMKDGFTATGSQAEAYGGSFGRRAASIQSGGNDGRWGYYGNVDYFEEDGWRDFSRSKALRAFAAVGRHEADWTVDFSAAYGDTELRGNGSSPAELLALDRAQVFTHPDLTENTLKQVILAATRTISTGLQLAGNAYYRDIDTDTFNGDGSNFEECDIGGEEFLVEDEFDDDNGDGRCSSLDDDDIELVLDMNGQPIAAELDDQELNAVNNIGRREQQSYGVSTQLTLTSELGGKDHHLTAGLAYNEGRASFNSRVEVASLLANRATSRTGIFAQEFATDVASEVTNASIYFVDTLELSERVAVTLSGRYNDTRIRLADRSGETPELNGSHGFSRFNPAAGVTFNPSAGLTIYASYGESARAPSPVELACASEDAPCNLPNAFLADPPLDQVVARSFEAGVRGNAPGLQWSAGAFQTINRDDILFQTTGGTQANVGFFDNVGDTRRAGVELRISQMLSRWRWSADYTFLDATFEDAFIVNSPNHPVFEEQPDSARIVGEGKLLTPAGASIPGIPQHQANLGIDFDVSERFSLGAEVVLRSGVYLRGDEPNLLDKTDEYAIVNLRGEYRVGPLVTVFVRIDNALDKDYETFGLLGEPDEVFADFEDPRFFGAGAPFGAWAGVKVKL